MHAVFPESESLALLAAREERLLSALDSVIERRAWNAGQRRAYQLETLRSLLAYAYEEIPLYRDKYQAAGFHPAQVRSLDDVAQIPVLTKADLRLATAQQLRSSKTRSPAWLFSSSGSTGTPSRIYRSDESLWNYIACGMAIYYEWCGGRPIDNCLYFLDLSPGRIDFAVADLLRTVAPAERIISVAEPTGRLVEALDEFSPEYISSYPSTMRNVASELKRQRREHTQLRLLHLTAELLDQRTRSILQDVFPRADIVETYSSTEAGLMGYRCARGQMHVLEENVIAEITDSPSGADDPAGEVVVTDLTNWATPIIRYRGLGDYCRLASPACACGREGRALTALEGRIAESILRADGTWLSPYTFVNALETVEDLRQVQVIQHDIHHFEILAIRDPSARSNDEIGNAVRGSLMAILHEPGAVTCGVTFVDRILAAGAGHKAPLVVSHVEKPL